jgi:hypothetical protein
VESKISSIKISGIQNIFNKNERLAGMDCLNGFLKRNPEIRELACESRNQLV